MDEQLKFEFMSDASLVPRYPETTNAILYTPKQLSSKGSNYIANDEIYPTEIIFDDGRVVKLEYDSKTRKVFLEVTGISN
jgi:hypothetical protein